MIYSNRLRLRSAEKTDLPRFVAWLNDPEVRRHLLINLPLSMTQEERWYDSMSQRQPAEQVLVIEVREGEDWPPIGTISFHQIDWVNRSTEVGILIGEKAYWNQGYGRDAMRLMLRHGFSTLNLNRIYLHVFEDNLRGIRAYERAGFIQEGRLRQDVFREGRYWDVLIMSVLREEWRDGTF